MIPFARLADVPSPLPSFPPPEPRASGPVCGVLESVERIGDVHIVSLRLDEPVDDMPGQYARVIFDGFPARAFHCSARLDGSITHDEIVLHIQASGTIGAAIGETIRPGHPFVASVLGDEVPSGATDHACDAQGLARVWSLVRRRSSTRRAPTVRLDAAGADGRYVAYMSDLLRARGCHVVPLDLDHRVTRHDTLVVSGASPALDRAEEHARRMGATVHGRPRGIDRTGRPLGMVRTLRERIATVLVGRTVN